MAASVWGTVSCCVSTTVSSGADVFPPPPAGSAESLPAIAAMMIKSKNAIRIQNQTLLYTGFFCFAPQKGHFFAFRGISLPQLLHSFISFFSSASLLSTVSTSASFISCSAGSSASGAPHSEQNFEVSGFSVPHCAHFFISFYLPVQHLQPDLRLIRYLSIRKHDGCTASQRISFPDITFFDTSGYLHI